MMSPKVMRDGDEMLRWWTAILWMQCLLVAGLHPGWAGGGDLGRGSGGMAQGSKQVTRALPGGGPGLGQGPVEVGLGEVCWSSFRNWVVFGGTDSGR